MIVRSLRTSKLAPLLKNGAIGVIPTDTIYGVSCSAFDKEAVERMMVVRRRDESKPSIILIGDLTDLSRFGIVLAEPILERLRSIWPAPVSIILPCTDNKFHYLHRGTNSIAVRMPSLKPLCSLLKKTGPLITTSVNPEGQPPATTIAEAQEYFGNQLDFYIDVGKRVGKPSTLARLNGDDFMVLRQGDYRIFRSFPKS